MVNQHLSKMTQAMEIMQTERGDPVVKSRRNTTLTILLRRVDTSRQMSRHVRHSKLKKIALLLRSFHWLPVWKEPKFMQQVHLLLPVKSHLKPRLVNCMMNERVFKATGSLGCRDNNIVQMMRIRIVSGSE
eukprot:6490993-Amphidinium_carterae.1